MSNGPLVSQLHLKFFLSLTSAQRSLVNVGCQMVDKIGESKSGVGFEFVAVFSKFREDNDLEIIGSVKCFTFYSFLVPCLEIDI